jgi:hypothetical protein
MIGVPNLNMNSLKIKMKYLYLSKSKKIPFDLKDMFKNKAFKEYY